MNQVTVNNIDHTYKSSTDSIEVLRDVSFDVPAQQFLCVLGPSGCGKTTLLKIIARLVRPDGGSVDHCLNMDSSDLRFGMMFQQSTLMPWRNVIENVVLPMEILFPNMAKTVIGQRAVEMLSLVGLSGCENLWVRELSGGMAQRAALARALIHDPQLLLLDEPFGSLDALSRETMGEELLRIWQEYKKTVIMVTHSITEAILLSDRVIVLSNRPATIKLDIPIDFRRPRDPTIRFCSEFSSYSEQIHQAIANN